MAKIFVPTSVKNEAMKVVSSVLGAVSGAGSMYAIAKRIHKDHHDKIVRELKANGHSHVVKEDHEAAPPNHELLSHTL